MLPPTSTPTSARVVVVTSPATSAASEALAQRLVKQPMDWADEGGISLQGLLNTLKQLVLLLLLHGRGIRLGEDDLETRLLGVDAGCERRPKFGDLDVGRESDLIAVFVGVEEGDRGGGELEAGDQVGGEGVEGRHRSGGKGEQARGARGGVGEFESVGGHLSAVGCERGER